MKNSHCVLVIPCFNEAARLPIDQFSIFLNEYPEIHLHFVDDGSSDQTTSVVNKLVHQFSNCSLSLIEVNVGKGEAIRRGINETDIEYEFIGYWDADLSTPLCELFPMLAILKENSQLVAVFGSRVRMLGFNIKRTNLRHYLGRLFATAASIAIQMPVYDTQCGAKVFRNCEMVTTAFQEPFGNRWNFDVELLLRLKQYSITTASNVEDLTVTEYPLRYWENHNDSRVNLVSGFVAFCDLFRIFRIRQKTIHANIQS